MTAAIATETGAKAAAPIWMQWVIPIVVAWVSSLLTAGLAWMAFQSNAGYATHATITGNQAEIVALQERQHSTDTQIANFPAQYVSQNAFAEFKARYDRDKAEEHDFRIRIDSKMDTLLSERPLTQFKPKVAYDLPEMSAAK